MLRFNVAGRAHYGLANNYYRTKSASFIAFRQLENKNA